jgi:hypothetical protein
MDTRAYLLPTYAAYTAVSVGLIVFLARTLYRNGRVFLEDVFKDNPQLADAVNHLLVIGFYMLNFGYASLMLRAEGAATATEAVEVLSYKLGVLVLTLGVMHFGNLFVFHRLRARARAAVLPPPVVPQMRIGPRADSTGTLPAFEPVEAARPA